MNILYVHNRPSGGAGESLYQILEVQNSWNSFLVFTQDGFLKEKFENLSPKVKIWYLDDVVTWLYSYKKQGGLLYILFRIYHLRKSLRFMFQLYRIIKKNKIDCIHSNSIYIIETGILARFLGIPHVTHMRELLDLDHYNYPLTKKFIIGSLRNTSEVIICNSNRTMEGIKRIIGSDSKLKVIYNLVDPSKNSLDIKVHLGLKKNILTIAIVGWITPRKRIEDFMELASYFEDNDNYKFLVIGGWGTNKAYNEMIQKKLDRAKNIILTGVMGNAIDYFESIDLIMCPCYTESFGRTVGEALAAGTPAIGVADCAVSEIIDHGETGFLVKKGDVPSMIQYTKLILENESLRIQMGKLGKVRMQQKFSSSVTIPQYYNLYKQITKSER